MSRQRPPHRNVHRGGADLIGLHKQHFVCFGCRKQFRPRGSDGAARRVWDTSADPPHWRWQPPSREHVACPQCRAPMVAAGRDFKAPRRGDRRQWLKVELLLRLGYGFDPGQSGPGPRPRRLSDTVEFMRTWHPHGDSARAVPALLREIARKRPR